MTQRALILFAHGARDPKWAEPFRRLQQITQARLPAVKVELAFLELMTPRLSELVGRLVGEGVADITVVPVFFGQGGHVLRDLPAMVGQLRQDYPALSLHAAGAVGEDAQVLDAIAGYCLRALSL